MKFAKTAVGTVVVALAGAAHAVVIDMRPPPGANQTSGFINGGFYMRGDRRPAGSGVIHSFVRIQSNNTTEEGYNTSGRPVSYDENTSMTFTHDIQFGD